MFHTVYVLIVMIIAPIICTIFEYLKEKKELLNVGCKWFVVWTIGVRALTAGFTQFTHPQYTMSLLNVGIESEIIIRELGALQSAVGITGILSLIKKSYKEPALMSYGIFMFGASFIHISRISVIDFGEVVSLMGDMLIVVITLIYFISSLFKKSS